MTWGSDDWNWWIRGDREGRQTGPAQFDILHEILANVPGRETKTVAHVGPADASCLRFLSTHFSAMVLIDEAVERVGPLRSDAHVLDPGTSDQSLDFIRSSCHRFDVVLAVATLARPVLADLDAALQRVHGCIAEGGLLLATFPAARRESVAREMHLRTDESTAHSGRLHEVELQYRLRRAGFRGVRIRRILDDTGSRVTEGESLLCMAARRANN